MTLREYIREARLARGLSQRDLADLLVVTHVAVSEWETGRRPVPRRRLPALAAHLVVDSTYLRELWDAAADERDKAALARRA
jgi:transcriptional regulator with XRE-family HTH domain